MMDDATTTFFTPPSPHLLTSHASMIGTERAVSGEQPSNAGTATPSSSGRTFGIGSSNISLSFPALLCPCDRLSLLVVVWNYWGVKLTWYRLGHCLGDLQAKIR